MDRFADLQRGLPPATLVSLIDQCIADMVERLPSLNNAIADRDTAAIEEAAHTLAGMGGTYGLAGAEKRMRKVMAAARRRDFITADREAEQMPAEIERAHSAIRGMIRELAA